MDDGVKIPGLKQAVPLAVDGEQAEVDACPDCDSRHLEPLRRLLKVIGSRTEHAGGADDSPQPERDAAMSQCPICPSWMDVRSRLGHAKKVHAHLNPGEIDWRYGEDVNEVWLCTCGLTFPSFRGRNMHARRTDHPNCNIPENDVTQEPKRPT